MTSATIPNHAAEPDEFASWCLRYLDGALAEDDAHAFADLLTASAEASDAFARVAQLDVRVAKAVDESGGAPGRTRRMWSHRLLRHARQAALACAAVAAAVLLVRWFASGTDGRFDSAVATVTRLQGAAVADDAEGRRILALRDAVRPGDALRPARGARLELTYADGTVLSTGDGARLELLAGRSGKHLRLHAGELVVAAAPQPPGIPLVVSTSDARATVLGTRFKVKTVAAGTAIEVSDGRVEVTRVGNGRSVVLEGGYCVFVGEESDMEITKGRFSALLMAGAVVAAQVQAATGADVNEADITRTVHVNPSHEGAGDDNTGGADEPVRTITRGLAIAIAVAKSGAGVKVMVYPGVYREEIYLSTGNDNEAPVVVEATRAGAAVVTGSDVWGEGWERRDDGVFAHSWPHDWGVAKDIWAEYGASMDPVLRRREMVFVNGTRMALVGNAAYLDPGCFLVDDEADLLLVRPHRGVDLAAAKVEVGTRARLLYVNHSSNVVLRGLSFEHSACFADAAVMVSNSSNCVLEDITCDWNNWAGLVVNVSKDMTLRRCTANHNNCKGFAGSRVVNLLVEDCETSYNGDRGWRAGYTNWDFGGVKFLEMHGATVRRHRAIHNQTCGVWFDWDNRDVVIEDSVVVNNRDFGVFLEASVGPIEVRDCLISHNAPVGLYIASTNEVSVVNCVLTDNEVVQLQVWGDGGKGRSGKNWRTDEPFNSHPVGTRIYNCALSASDPASRLMWSHDSPAVWERFVDTLTSQNNFFHHSSGPEAFFDAAKTPIDLDAWWRWSEQDGSSAWHSAARGADAKLVLRCDDPRSRRTEPAELSLTLSVSSLEAAVTKVDFVDGNAAASLPPASGGFTFSADSPTNVWLGEATSPPWRLTASGLSAGEHRIVAWALDKSGLLHASNEVTVRVVPRSGAGHALREYWRDDPPVKSGLASHPAFDRAPDVSDWPRALRAQSGIGDHYVQRLSGWIHPPATGAYTFWIAGDDDCELHLSDDHRITGARKVAHVPDFTGPQEWEKYSTQKSAPVTLEAGRTYYVRVLHREGGGGDHVAVAWKGPGIERQVVAGAYLSCAGPGVDGE